MIDSHAHIHDPKYDGDREAILARAKAAGLTTIITVGTDLNDSTRAQELVNALDGSNGVRIVHSVGIHPHEAKDAPEDIASAFAPLLDDTRAVAIGETGLDYYYNHSSKEDQTRVLRAQIRGAKERGLPLIFHQRDAYDDFISILREEFPGEPIRGVIHCFTGDATQANTFVNEFDLKLGIGGVVTFKTAEGLREAVGKVGIAPLILETDCPYLAPVPYRGQRNEPAYVLETAKKIAELLELPLEKVTGTTDRTASTLFKL